MRHEEYSVPVDSTDDRPIRRRGAKENLFYDLVGFMKQLGLSK